MQDLYYKGTKIEFDKADITTRLRDVQKWTEAAIIEGTPYYTLAMVIEAADEIERLRMVIAEMASG